jgi:hypothetical protein
MRRYGLSLSGDRPPAVAATARIDLPGESSDLQNTDAAYAHQARRWAKTAIEAITKITGTITRQ